MTAVFQRRRLIFGDFNFIDSVYNRIVKKTIVKKDPRPLKHNRSDFYPFFSLAVGLRFRRARRTSAARVCRALIIHLQRAPPPQAAANIVRTARVMCELLWYNYAVDDNDNIIYVRIS
jgi:hypothetical protein